MIELVPLLPGQFDMLLSWCAANNFFVSCFLSLWWTQQQLLSVVGLFTPPIHIFFFFFLACPFSWLENEGVGGVYCLTTAISQWDCSSHSSCGVQVNSPHKEEKYEHWPQQTGIFLPSNDCAGERGSKLRIRVRLRETEKKKMCDKVHGWQYVKWTEVTGSWVGNGKPWHVRVLDYHDMTSARIRFPFQTRRKYKQVQHKRREK